MHAPSDGQNPIGSALFRSLRPESRLVPHGAGEGFTIIPDTHSSRDNIYRAYLKFMDGLPGCRHTGGMWYQIMDRSGETSPGGYASWLASSWTTMAGYAMERGVKQGWLPTYAMQGAGGSNWIEYAYARRYPSSEQISRRTFILLEATPR